MGIWGQFKGLFSSKGGKGGKIDRRHRVDADQWADNHVWVLVRSSNVAGIAYDKAARTLYVEFHGGAVYPYFDVPITVAKQMFNSASLGKFVHRRLIPTYETISRAKGMRGKKTIGYTPMSKSRKGKRRRK